MSDLSAVLTPSYLSRLANNVRRRRQILPGIVPRVPNLAALAGTAGYDKASAIYFSNADGMARVVKPGGNPITVPLPDLIESLVSIVTTKEEHFFSSDELDVLADPRTNGPARALIIAAAQMNLLNRVIVGVNAGIGECLRAGTITRSSNNEGVAIDYLVSTYGVISTLSGDDIFGTTADAFTNTAAISLGSFLSDLTDAAKMNADVVVSNYYTWMLYLKNNGFTNEEIYITRKEMASTGKVEIGGKMIRWIIEDGAYTPDGGSSTKYFPNGYICGIAGAGEPNADGMEGLPISPIHVEVSKAERPRRLAGMNELSPFAWIPEGGDGAEKNCQESMIVTSREMCMVNNPYAVGSLYVIA